MQPRSTLEAVLDDYRPRGIDQIVTDDPAVAEKAAGIAPVQVIPENLLTIYKIESQLKKAQERRVWLSSGGTLVIDPCEAMTVIDVNTAKFTGKRELEDTVLRLNLEACGEIARQVRLRNLSGIIIIDMIDMNLRKYLLPFQKLGLDGKQRAVYLPAVNIGDGSHKMGQLLKLICHSPSLEINQDKTRFIGMKQGGHGQNIGLQQLGLA